MIPERTITAGIDSFLALKLSGMRWAPFEGGAVHGPMTIDEALAASDAEWTPASSDLKVAMSARELAECHARREFFTSAPTYALLAIADQLARIADTLENAERANL